MTYFSADNAAYFYKAGTLVYVMRIKERAVAEEVLKEWQHGEALADMDCSINEKAEEAASIDTDDAVHYTADELKVLKALQAVSIDACGECTEEQNMSFASAAELAKILNKKKQAVGGLITSLLKKGAIVEEDDNTFALTHLNF